MNSCSLGGYAKFKGNYSQMQKELLNLLTARKGHFRLESGHHGDLWLDLDLLFRRPRDVRPFVVELANRLAKYKSGAVCGPLVGGALIAQMVASELEVEFYYTERSVPLQRDSLYSVEYRLPKGLGKLIDGKNVVIVDDVINAGSAVRGTFAELQFWRARPVVIGALLVLGSSTPNFFAEQDVAVESIASLPSGLWAPRECPLCASQIPLEEIIP
jgi:orotate phosphoribosyltransferase